MLSVEKNCCCHKKKERSKEKYRALCNRLSRIEGQIRGLRDMLDSDAYCPDILAQAAAANTALNAFSRELLSSHIRSCVVDDVRAGACGKSVFPCLIVRGNYSTITLLDRDLTGTGKTWFKAAEDAPGADFADGRERTPMRIVIAGAGKMGTAIARQLCREGHDLALIDQRQDKVDSAVNSMDVIGCRGSCAAPETLTEVEAGRADLFIAATGADEANLIGCQLARKMGAKHAICLLRNPAYIQSAELLKETMHLSFSIHPDYVTAEEISRVLQFPAAIRVESFPDCEMEIVTFRIMENSKLIGVPLRKLGAKFGQKVLVCCVERGDTVQIPGGDFVLNAGDRISVTGSPDVLRRFFISAGTYRRPVKNVILLGGSRSAVHLTRLLESTGVDVTIIEQDNARCQVLAELLKNTDIHCADGTDTTVLQENGISHADGFVALTGFDEDNIILGLYASKVGVGKVISKVNSTKFVELLKDIFPDTTLSPQDLVSERIFGYVRGLEHASEISTIEALYHLGDPRVTATEFVVGAKAGCTAKPLKDLPMTSGVLLAAVIRGAKSFLPDGQTLLLPGDRVIVVTADRNIVELDDILLAPGRAL